MTSTIPEEEVNQLISDQINDAIQEALHIKLGDTIDECVERVQSKLDFDPDQEDVDIEKIVTNCVLDSMTESDTPEQSTNDRYNISGTKTVEIPVAGRDNKGESTEVTLMEYEVPTKTIEVPLRGGDVEDPDTMEWEVPDPKPMDLNEDPLENFYRNNSSLYDEEDEEDDEYDPADIPEGGLPFYQ